MVYGSKSRLQAFCLDMFFFLGQIVQTKPFSSFTFRPVFSAIYALLPYLALNTDLPFLALFTLENRI